MRATAVGMVVGRIGDGAAVFKTADSDATAITESFSREDDASIGIATATSIDLMCCVAANKGSTVLSGAIDEMIAGTIDGSTDVIVFGGASFN